MAQEKKETAKPSRSGFLPFRTNGFDRVFISVVLMIAIHLLWLRFVEQFASIWFATVISVILGFVIVRKG